MPHPQIDSLDIVSLRALYQQEQITPRQVIAEVLHRIKQYNDPALFIHLLSPDDIDSQLAQLETRQKSGASLPLYGLPFAIKDNIDYANHPTTAACPAYAFTPSISATAVEKLCQAGAILIGKTNLDQFATGLVGTRSPYGTPRNPFNADYIPGGSSSGSAVAVAAGLVTFALGTDTAGSGRVPAAFNNIVGLKPTRGRISTAGVVPACRSLDCVSIFALTCDDAAQVLKICVGYDPADAYSKTDHDWPAFTPVNPHQFRFGVPRADQLEFLGDADTPHLFANAIETLVKLGGTRTEFAFAPFAQAARLLYDGPWVAERFTVIEKLLASNPEAILQVTRRIIEPGKEISAVDAFKTFHHLQSLIQQTRLTWEKVDCLLLPTAGTIYNRQQIEADPIRLNSNLGYYTNFTNLLDLSALALPAGFAGDGLPRGVTLFARAGQEQTLLELGARFQRAINLPLGATKMTLSIESSSDGAIPNGWIELAVLGAHLKGLPLNHQLTSAGARFVRDARTSVNYRFYALRGTNPPKPGMIRVTEAGHQIDLEIWAMSPEEFGKFVAAIPPPLGIGTIELEDQTTVKGFLCEPHAITGAKDISAFGGWRGFLASLKSAKPL